MDDDDAVLVIPLPTPTVPLWFIQHISLLCDTQAQTHTHQPRTFHHNDSFADMSTPPAPTEAQWQGFNKLLQTFYNRVDAGTYQNVYSSCCCYIVIVVGTVLVFGG